MPKFEELGVEVVGVSIDSQLTHHAWPTPPWTRAAAAPGKYTLAADVKHDDCRTHDVETEGGWRCAARS